MSLSQHGNDEPSQGVMKTDLMPGTHPRPSCAARRWEILRNTVYHVLTQTSIPPDRHRQGDVAMRGITLSLNLAGQWGTGSCVQVNGLGLGRGLKGRKGFKAGTVVYIRGS